MGEQYKNASKFNRAFKLGQLFDDDKLTDNSPCNKCKISKEYSEIANSEYFLHYGSDIDRENELSEVCKKCIDKINYDIRCFAKLKEYEKINVSTKYIKDNLYNM